MEKALINRTIVTLYDRPSIDRTISEGETSHIQDEGLYGMPVDILETVSKEWVKIRTHYRYEGYVQLQNLWLMTDQEARQREEETLKFVTGSYVDVVSLPKVQGVRLGTLTRGAIIRWAGACEEEKGWDKVVLNDGTVGYMKSAFLGKYYEHPSDVKVMRLRKNIVSAAGSYLGVQYRWGGKSPLGIDCSGLCSMAYLLNGMIIYRDAKIKEGFPIRAIAFEDKEPGDLIYYKGHVTMYIGEDCYIHATARPGSDGVVINSFNPNHPNYRADLAENIVAVGSVF